MELLIWGGDHDQEDADGKEYIESNLSCPNCDAFFLWYQPLDCDSERPEGS
jgi:hypothetical protein